MLQFWEASSQLISVNNTSNNSILRLRMHHWANWKYVYWTTLTVNYFSQFKTKTFQRNEILLYFQIILCLFEMYEGPNHMQHILYIHILSCFLGKLFSKQIFRSNQNPTFSKFIPIKALKCLEMLKFNRTFHPYFCSAAIQVHANIGWSQRSFIPKVRSI